MSVDEERRSSTRIGAWFAVACLLAIAALCLLAINFAGNWMTP